MTEPRLPGQCCPDDFGGSHYHCVYCGCVSGMYGHLKGNDPRGFCPPPSERPEHAAQFVLVKEGE